MNYTYDGDGNATAVVTKSGATTLSTIPYQYDARGNVTQIADANGNVATRSYDAANNLGLETRTGSASSSASTALYTRYVYDAENHLRFAISGEGRVTEYTYTPTGQVELVREFTKDAHRYAIGATVPALGAMEAWVTSLGDISSVKVTQNVYDPRGNLKETHRYGVATSGGLGATDEGTAKTTYAYDQHGRLLSRQVGDQASESFVYDGLDRLILSTDSFPRRGGRGRFRTCTGRRLGNRGHPLEPPASQERGYSALNPEDTRARAEARTLQTQVFARAR